MGVGALALVAGLCVTGCSPVKMGAAAIVGSQRITIANLDTETSKLSAAATAYPGIVSLSQQQITQETLAWLIRFKINEQLASQSGITVSTAQQQDALNLIFTEAKSQAQQSGISNVTWNLILVANGIAPNLKDELGRYQAIETQYLASLNGGRVPTDTNTLNALEPKLTHAQCTAAKSLYIKVNPQFGQMDYTNYSVVTTTDKVSRPSGAAQTASVSGLTPSC
jgi:hypothetical protein